jgi:hypothetical protein
MWCPSIANTRSHGVIITVSRSMVRCVKLSKTSLQESNIKVRSLILVIILNVEENWREILLVLVQTYVYSSIVRV